MTDLLTIGQFSRMCWLSVKALRLYDESGHLHPAQVDPANNYRYSARQAPIARAIAILRTLDKPLAEIREIVTASNADKVRAHLDAQEAVLAEHMEHDRSMLMQVESFIRKGAVMTYVIEFKDIEPVDVIGVTFEMTPESISDDGAKAMKQLYDAFTRPSIALGRFAPLRASRDGRGFVEDRSVRPGFRRSRRAERVDVAAVGSGARRHRDQRWSVRRARYGLIASSRYGSTSGI